MPKSRSLASRLQHCEKTCVTDSFPSMWVCVTHSVPDTFRKLSRPLNFPDRFENFPALKVCLQLGGKMPLSVRFSVCLSKCVLLRAMRAKSDCDCPLVLEARLCVSPPPHTPSPSNPVCCDQCDYGESFTRKQGCYIVSVTVETIIILISLYVQA